MSFWETLSMFMLLGGGGGGLWQLGRMCKMCECIARLMYTLVFS